MGQEPTKGQKSPKSSEKQRWKQAASREMGQEQAKRKKSPKNQGKMGQEPAKGQKSPKSSEKQALEASCIMKNGTRASQKAKKVPKPEKNSARIKLHDVTHRAETSKESQPCVLVHLKNIASKSSSLWRQPTFCQEWQPSYHEPPGYPLSSCSDPHTTFPLQNGEHRSPMLCRWWP